DLRIISWPQTNAEMRRSILFHGCCPDSRFANCQWLIAKCQDLAHAGLWAEQAPHLRFGVRRRMGYSPQRFCGEGGLSHCGNAKAPHLTLPRREARALLLMKANPSNLTRGSTSLQRCSAITRCGHPRSVMMRHCSPIKSGFRVVLGDAVRRGMPRPYGDDVNCALP